MHLRLPASSAVRNSLAEPETGTPTVIVCNPPFRSTAPLPEGRTDLWARSGSMQLNFLQHIARGLPIGGACGGFRPGQHPLRVRCRSHRPSQAPPGVRRAHSAPPAHGCLRPGWREDQRALLRTRSGLAETASPATSQVWIYDFRSGLHFAARAKTAASDPILTTSCVVTVTGSPRSNRTATDRFRPVSYETLADTGLQPRHPLAGRDRSRRGSSPKEIALEIVDELRAALDEFKALAAELPDGSH